MWELPYSNSYDLLEQIKAKLDEVILLAYLLNKTT